MFYCFASSCSADPETAGQTDWRYTRMTGTLVTDIETVDAFAYEWFYPFAFGDFVLFENVAYECMNQHGMCSYFEPTFDWS